MRLIIAMVLMLAASGMAYAERRVALVMAADDYRSLRPLKNAVNDGRAMEAALDKLGFEVFLETNRDLRRMRRALDDFREDAKGADVALVFFSGHGVEISGDNRLLPVDASAATIDDLQRSSLPIEEVRDAVAAAAKVGLIMLDACRNDPFGAETATGRGASAIAAAVAKQVHPGLGRVGRAENILFAFSAAPGETASDGDGGNSPFTAALTKYLDTDGLEIRSVLTLVQQEVYDLSRGKQLPYVESGLPDVFFAASAKDQLPERERLLLAMADITPELRGQVEQIAGDADMPLAPLYGALVGLDRTDISNAELDARLREAADAFVKVRDEMKGLSSIDPEVTRLRTEAEEQLSLGAVEAARERLSEAAEIDSRSRQVLKANFVSRTLSEAATHVLSGGAARTDLDYALAIADYSRAVALFDEAGEAASAPEHADRRLSALFTLGDLYATTGDIAAAANTFRTLLMRAEQRGASDPDPTIRRDIAMSHGKLGDVKVTLGDLRGALADYRKTEAILAELTSGPAPRRDWLRELAIVHDDMSEVFLRLGDTGAAEEALRASFGIKQELARDRPDDAKAQRDVTVTLDGLGDIWQSTGDGQRAATAFDASLRIRQALAARDPANPLRQRDVSVSHDKIGDLKRELSEPEEALDHYRRARDIVIELARRSPLDTQLQRDISVGSNKIGNIQRDTGDIGAALASYREALDIAAILAKADPNNSEWQRDWSVTLEKVADILRRQDDRAGALAMFEQSLGIMQPLLDKDPANTDWQRDMSITLAEIGNLRLDGRDYAGAREALARCLEMRRGLAEADPGNALWQRDLVIAYADFAQVADDPKAVLTQALDLTLDLQRSGRLPPRHEYMADVLRQKLARLKSAGK